MTTTTDKPITSDGSCAKCGRDPQIACHVCGHLMYLSELDDAKDKEISFLKSEIHTLRSNLGATEATR